MSAFVVGDRVRTRDHYWHEGIYVGPIGPAGESIVHNDFDAKKVLLSHPEDYAQKGRPIFLAERTAPENRELVVERALGLLGTPFDLFRRNCQHIARYAQHGIPDSPRIRYLLGALGILALAGTGVFAIWVNGKEKT